jgi:hypothetical protein
MHVTPYSGRPEKIIIASFFVSSGLFGCDDAFLGVLVPDVSKERIAFVKGSVVCERESEGRRFVAVRRRDSSVWL